MEAMMKRFSRAVFLVVAAALAACSDSSVSPKNPSQANAVVDGGGYTADLTAGDTSRFSITVDPSKNMAFYLGAGNQIRFPAGSICDPSSTYGPDQWDAPCTVATAPITFNVKAWLDSQGNPRTDFDKHVRFVPSTDSNHWVGIASISAARCCSTATVEITAVSARFTLCRRSSGITRCQTIRRRVPTSGLSAVSCAFLRRA